MLRKHSIIKYVLLALLAVVGIFLCVVPFNVPASTDKYNSLTGSIQTGFDLRGGVSAIYTLEGANNSEIIDKNLSKLEKTIKKDGLNEFYLYRQGENKIRFDLTGVTETDSTFSYIENEKQLNITLEKASDGVEPRVYVTSEDVDYAYGTYNYDQAAYGVQIEFISKDSFSELKDEAKTTSAETAYIYLGEVSSENLFAEVAVSDLEQSLFVVSASGSSYSTTEYSSCREIAYSITAGVFGKEISLEEACFISPVFGENTLLWLEIASALIVLVTFVLLWVRYGDLGLLSILSLIFFLIINIFLLQAIPGIVLNLNGYLGVVLGFSIAVISHVVLIERIKKEYAIGKKIHIACKSGFRSSLWSILDLHFMLAIAGLFIWIIAPANVKCLGVTLLIGLLVSIFAIEALMRYFVRIYLPINAKNAKRMHLYRDANIVELKDEEEIAPNSLEGGTINE